MAEPRNNGAVLDASAVLYAEPGGQQVTQYLDGGVITAINLAEVMQRIRQRSTTDAEANDAPAVFAALGLQVHTVFTAKNAARSAEIFSTAQHLGLSLGDRCCLAIADDLPNGFAVTADAAWTKLPDELGIRVHCIR